MSPKLQKLDYHRPRKHNSIPVIVGLQVLDLMALLFVAGLIVAAVTGVVLLVATGLPGN